MIYVIYVLILTFFLLLAVLKCSDILGNFRPEAPEQEWRRKRDEEEAKRIDAANTCTDATDSRHNWEWRHIEKLGGADERFCRRCGIRFDKQLHEDPND